MRCLDAAARPPCWRPGRRRSPPRPAARRRGPVRRARCGIRPTARRTASTTAATCVGKALMPRTTTMSSPRPTTRKRGAVRPQRALPVPVSTTMSPVRKRTSGWQSRRTWVSTNSPRSPSCQGRSRAARRLDQLGMEHVERHEVQVVVELALAGEIAEDVGDAVIGVAHLEAPGRFQPARGNPGCRAPPRRRRGRA